MTRALVVALEALNLVVLGYFVVLNLVYLATTLLAFGELRRHSRRSRAVGAEDPVLVAGAPPVTVIVPMFGEEATCVDTVHALLSLDYPRLEILAVDDGSRDATAERLRVAFDLEPAPRARTADLETAPVTELLASRRHPNLWLVRKENGGKADALNAGLAHCHTPLFCAIDGDTLLERDALLRMIRPFLSDGHTVAAGGVVRVVNGCPVRDGEVREVRMPRNLLAGFQVVEYLRAFLVGRVGWAETGSTLIISGAFGLFRRAPVVAAGGYSTDTVGEDMELVVRLHRTLREEGAAYRVAFVPDPVAWTEAPAKLVPLARQRDRWQRGLIQTLLTHRVMMLNPRYGRIGMVAYPYFWFLEMMGPVVEGLGYVAFAVAALAGLVSPAHALVFLMLAVGFGMALSVGVLALEELTFRRYTRFRDLAALFGLGLLENVGYRQLVTFFRMKGTLSALRGREGWGHATTAGFHREEEAP